MSVIVIGDVHGYWKTLQALLKKLPDDKLCFCGDLIDRGPNSKEILEFVIKSKHHVVLGNHEHIMLDNHRGHYYDPSCWSMNGGISTRKSFQGKVPNSILDEIAKWPLYLKFDDEVDDKGRKLFVSHAGMTDVDADLDRCCESQEIIWGPDSQVELPGYFTVFGHMIQGDDPLIGDHFAAIDTGVHCRGHYSMKGMLTAYQFPSGKIWQQENIG